MNMRKVLIIFLCIISAVSNAANECRGYFEEQRVQIKDLNRDEVLTVEGTKLRISLGRLVERVGNFVRQNKRAPTIEELSVVSKVELQMMKGYFAKTSSPNILQIIAMAKTERPEVFKQFEMEYAEEAVKYLKKNFELPSDSYMAEFFEVSQAELRVIFGSNKGALDRIQEYQYKALEQFREKILVSYTRVAKNLGRTPEVEEVAVDLEISVEQLTKLIGRGKVFDKFEDIFEVARKKRPNAFKNVQNTNIFTEERLNRALADIRNSDVLVLTSAVAEASVEQGFYNALKVYHKARNATVLVRPVNLESSGLQKDLLDSDFMHVVINTIKFTRNLSFHNLKLLAKMMDPLTGTKKLGAGETRIYGHIQRRLETRAFVDSSLETLFNMTTGTITDPNYTGGKYVQERSGDFAMERHFYGAVILEKTSSRRAVNIPGLGRFHLRMIEYVKKVPNELGVDEDLKDPYFLDLDTKYYSSGRVEKVRAEAFMFGDLHFGATDQHASLEAKKNLIRILNPKRIYTEDDYDGKEINHHERDKIITQGMLAMMRANSLEEGLHYLRSNLEAILEVAPPDAIIIRKRSNHPHWVERYIQGGWFMKESQNTDIGLELAKAMREGMDPIDYFLKKHMKPDDYKRVVTLDSGEPINEGSRSVVVHMHGDKGTNGAKGSIQSFIEATPAAIFGHTHYMQIYNRIMNMGAMAKYPQPYAKEGFSKALIGNASVGPSGEAQFYIYDSISGEYFRDESKPLDNPSDFFAPGYPYAVPTYDPTSRSGPSQGALDQYSR